MFQKVIVGISGGVDSAVASFFLKERGYKVLGVFMKNWDEYDETGRCSGDQDLKDAEYTCHNLGIELKQVNYVKEYWNSVFSNFLEDYEKGLTPNPDILCNKVIKFDLFYKFGLEKMKYDAIATGHYAKTSFGNYLEHFKENGDVRLLLPKDTLKDQTFFLSGIQRNSIRRTMFPLADLLKSDVKNVAIKCGLKRLANKKESTGICFVGNRDFKKFIREYILSKPGKFVDIATKNIIGEHDGIHQWTIGQRCRIPNMLQPYFVARKDLFNNTIYVASGHNNTALFSNKIIATNVNWLCPEPYTNGHELRCRFRFQHTKPLVSCTVQKKGNQDSGEITILLDDPLRAITPGQYAVFYSKKECLGSARIITSSLVSIDVQNEYKRNEIKNCKYELI